MICDRLIKTTIWCCLISADTGQAAAQESSTSIGGGYTNPIVIPVEDSKTKNITAALFRPKDKSPYPVIIYMSGCAGLNPAPDQALQKEVIAHSTSMGIAVLILDPYSPRGENRSPCSGSLKYIARGAEDIYAAARVLGEMPEIDMEHLFVQGYSLGGNAAISATGAAHVDTHKEKFAGVIAFYPVCVSGPKFASPTLIFVGDQDPISPAALCRGIADKNVEVVVYPGATHGFAMPGLDTTFLGSHVVFDERAAQDAEQRIDVFLKAHGADANHAH